MDEAFEADIAAAGDALQALADGPAQEAADAVSRAFEGAGRNIETALLRAARSGELEFRSMAEAILRDLARIGAEAVLARSGQGPSAPNMIFNITGEAQGANSVASRAGLASTLARAAASGRRFL